MRKRSTGEIGVLLEVPPEEAEQIRRVAAGRSLSALVVASVTDPGELDPFEVIPGLPRTRLFLELDPAFVRGLDGLITGSHFKSRAAYLRACLSQLVRQAIQE